MSKLYIYILYIIIILIIHILLYSILAIILSHDNDDNAESIDEDGNM